MHPIVLCVHCDRLLKLSDFDYELPRELIAQAPAAARSASRLLHLDGRSGELRDRWFCDLPQRVNAGDVLVMNDTRVIKARLVGRKQTGGRAEVMVERVLGRDEILAQVGVNNPPRAGSMLIFADAVKATVLERCAELYRLRFEECSDVFALLERHGSVPLPLYIDRDAADYDAERYQTVYARARGAVAAPTAGLHFDDVLLAVLKARGVTLAWLTLHVGAGTFQPVRAENPAEHRMHSEWYSLPQATVDAVNAARDAGRSVIAVGTTSLRALETAAAADGLHAGSAETRLFIVPGYRFRVVDRLITNFHLPRSTLLMLVSAFAGMDNIRRAYRHAVESRFRFFSYGDAMLIERQQG